MVGAQRGHVEPPAAAALGRGDERDACPRGAMARHAGHSLWHGGDDVVGRRVTSHSPIASATARGVV